MYEYNYAFTGIFDNNFNLQYLYMGRNFLSQLDSDVFSKLSSLTVLDMSHNHIEV